MKYLFLFIICFTHFDSFSQSIIDTNFYHHNIPKEKIKDAIKLKKIVEKGYLYIFDSIFTRSEIREISKYLNIRTTFYFGYHNGTTTNKNGKGEKNKEYSINIKCINFVTKDTITNTSTHTEDFEILTKESSQELILYGYKTLIIPFLYALKAKKEPKNAKKHHVNVVYEGVVDNPNIEKNLIEKIDIYSYNLLLDKQYKTPESLRFNVYHKNNQPKFNKKEVLYYVKIHVKKDENANYDINYDFRCVNSELMTHLHPEDSKINSVVKYDKKLLEKSDFYWLYAQLYKRLSFFIHLNAKA